MDDRDAPPRVILVTGASGFVGTRLCEHLRLGRDIATRALVHRPERAARLARLDVEHVLGDLADPDSLRRAVDGCDAIVHCAYGTEGPRRVRRRLTGQAAGELASIAAGAGVHRFVHLSSVAVWGFSPGAVAHGDQAPVAGSRDPYVSGKVEAEAAVRAAFPGSTILRPTNVWGPWSAAFTVAPVLALREGRVALVGDGAGPANLLYVDNLCHAILRALDTEEACGKTIVVSDPDSPTWRELYDAYASLGGWTVRTLPEEDYPRPSRVRATALALSESPAVRSAARRVLGRSRERVREALLAPPELPSPELAALQTSGASYSTANARRMLGYAPPVTFERGLRLTEEWLRFARLV